MANQIVNTRTYRSSGDYEANGLISAGGGVLHHLYGFNAASSPVFVMLFDSKDVPDNDAEPEVVIYAKPQSNFDYDSPKGDRFEKGICWSASINAPLLKHVRTGTIWMRVTFDG